MINKHKMGVDDLIYVLTGAIACHSTNDLLLLVSLPMQL
jgi:hypothetical protein